MSHDFSGTVSPAVPLKSQSVRSERPDYVGKMGATGATDGGMSFDTVQIKGTR